MPKYIVFNTVKNDGVGDFNHFEDIINSLNHTLNGVELLLVVSYQPSLNDQELYANLRARTASLGHKYIFGSLDEHRDLINSNATTFIKELDNLSQAIIISYDDIFLTYEPYLPSSIVLKYISEHDAETNKRTSIVYPDKLVSCRREMHIRGMGLFSQQSAYGVKIKDLDNLTADEALRVLQVITPDFLDTLIAATAVADEYELMSKYIIIPAYFSYNHAFVYFLKLLAANPSFAQDRDIIVYQSGSRLTALTARELSYIGELLRSIEATSVQVYTADSLDRPVEYIGSGKRSVKISVFCGFRIHDKAYQALYHLAPLVGVSGDNTFELAIEARTLPIYWSTNIAFKRDTYQGLINIVNEPRLEIDDKSRAELTRLFQLSMATYEEFDDYLMLDLPLLAQAWPVVAVYLKENYNFYNNLNNIVCEKLPRSALPVRRLSGIVSKFMIWDANSKDEFTDIQTSSSKCIIS